LTLTIPLKALVKAASVKYVFVPPYKVLPAVMLAAERLTVLGEQTAAGFVITRVGLGLIVTTTGFVTEGQTVVLLAVM
ncbi:hypothetical protein DD594_28335, partial [Enterobacter cloacae complex sp. 4DZ1-17B1]|uniref:hypothetical protein n=1 Tax=Enterobacter cloacae complex sp. 4DZ1-17B1 TaxID=2511991 RepID=UPI00102529B4